MVDHEVFFFYIECVNVSKSLGEVAEHVFVRRFKMIQREEMVVQYMHHVPCNSGESNFQSMTYGSRLRLSYLAY